MLLRIPPHVTLCTQRALGPRALNQRLKEIMGPLDVLRQFNDYGDLYDEVNIATTWSKLGRARGRSLGLIRSHDGERLYALRDRTLQEADSWKARSLANTAHALAKLQLHSDGWRGLWAVLAAASHRELNAFNPQELVNAAWAFVTADHAAPALLDAIAAKAAPRVGEFNSQDFANTAWAFATAGHAAPALFDEIAAAAAPRVGEFTSQELANMAWACAKAGHTAPALFDAIAAEAAPRLDEFQPQNLANTAWAYATAGHAAPALFDAIAAEVAPRLDEFKPQELANTAWAFAKAGHAAPAMLDAIAAEAAPQVGEFTSQELANTAWAFISAAHAAPALFDAIAAEAAPRLGEFSSRNLSNTAWAFATAGHATQALFDAIAAEAGPRLGEFNPQDLTSTAWSFAVADTLSSVALAEFFGHDFGRRCDVLAGSFSDEQLSQLHQWWLWYASERGQTTELLRHELLQRCRMAFSATEARPSNLQRQVGSTLSSLGLDPQEEVWIEVGYSLDFVVEWRGRQVAIEVDGPSHFVKRKPTGATMIKHRQLRHLGWRLVSIPYWEWNELAEALVTPGQGLGAAKALRERQKAYIKNGLACLPFDRVYLGFLQRRPPEQQTNV
jgi:hypothetical protein